MKKSIIITLLLSFLGLGSVSIFGVTQATVNKDTFADSGYILYDNKDNVNEISFESDAYYQVYKQGYVTVKSEDGKVKVDSENFVHLDNGDVFSFSNGTLFDFNDLSDNFINYYYIPSGMEINNNGTGRYSVNSSEVDNEFGENLWKISNNKYIIQSPSITVHMSEGDERLVNSGYVQVTESKDGIVKIYTEDNSWITFQEETYIETKGGVKIHPVSKLITNGDYKLSLAKITVSPEDTIVLTEDETRRQIVPQINIETIDGKDGENGAIGENGTDGENGQNGTKGSNALNGQNGGNGAEGNYAAWQNSINDGSFSGTYEEYLEHLNGEKGEDGDPGKKGVTGNSVVGTSSINSALPTMSIIDWQVSATGLKGVISITDESGLLGNIDDSDKIKYPAVITIKDNKTNEIINCYTYNSSPDPDNYYAGVLSENCDNLYETDEVAFIAYKTDASGNGTENVLKPDTSYTLSVSAYYATEGDGLVYKREFISRTFYTDSTGVTLSPNYSTINGFSFDVNVSSSYQQQVNDVLVFVLDGNQNKDFNLAKVDEKNNYTYVDLNYSGNSINLVSNSGNSNNNFASNFASSKFDTTVTLKCLDHNKDYYLWTYVDAGGIKTLTSQVLEMKTLKIKPTYDQEEPVSAYFNRVTGGVEVYRPKILDTDSGIISYTYYATNLATNEVTKRTVTPSEKEPIVFVDLTPREQYVFGVSIEFYDNEKTYYFDTAKSEAVEFYGATLPKVYLTTNNVDENSFSGTLTVNLTNDETSLKVSSYSGEELRLDIYADGIYDQTITIFGQDTTFKSENTFCEAMYRNDDMTNTAVLDLSFEKLCANTNYTLTLSGKIDLNDGNGPQRRTLGIASFFTRETPTLKSVFSLAQGQDTSIALNLLIEPQNKQDQIATNALINDMKNGELTLGLYSGTNKNQNLIVTTTLSGDEIENIDTDGIIITETTFSSTKINPNSEYTVKVLSYSDDTYKYDLGYVNYYDLAYPDYMTLNADGVLPTLLDEPSEGVKATPIKNYLAANYGGVYDKTLPDDCIVGYKIQANYDNAGRMATAVNYYAFEFDSFVSSMLSGDDPIRAKQDNNIDKTRKLYQVSLGVGDVSEVPSMVIFFGNDPQTLAPTQQNQSAARYDKGSYIFYAGDAVVVGSELERGMSRGFRYIFAYTVEFERKSDPGNYGLYPYDYSSTKNGSYENYRPIGAGLLNGVSLVSSNPDGKHYILNSGMQSAPSIVPSFNSYVYKTEVTAPGSATNPTATGTMEIHYRYTDPDSLIVESGDFATKLYWNDKEYYNLVPTEIDRVVSGETGNKWYKIIVPYVSNGPDSLEEATKNINLYTDITEYNAVKSARYVELLTQFGFTDDDLLTKQLLSVIPTDWSWDEYFNRAQNLIGLKYSVDNSTLNKNYFTINVEMNSGGEQNRQLLEYAKTRGTALKVTTQIYDDAGTNPDSSFAPKVIYLPLNISSLTDTTAIVAHLQTGELGSEYIGKKFKVDCELIYDNGLIGTKYTEYDNTNNPNPMFLIRNYKVKDEDNTSTYYTGYVKSSLSKDSDLPNANLIGSTSNDFSLKLRNVVKQDSRFGMPFKFILTNISIPSAFYYPEKYSFTMSSRNRVDEEIKNYGMIKSTSSINLFSPTDVITQLENVIPLVSLSTIGSTSSTISISRFNIKSFDQIDSDANGIRKLGIGLYETKQKAENLSSDRLGVKYIEINETELLNGDFVYHVEEDAIKFTSGISANNTYYVVFFGKIKGSDTVLIDASTSGSAVYSKSTLDGINVAINNIKYYNYGYFDKNLKIDYLVNIYKDINFRYDIYSSKEIAESDNITFIKQGDAFNVNHTQAPLVSYEYLKEKNKIIEPKYYTSGTVTIDMTPSELRTHLKDGGSYTVKMTAYEVSTTDAVVLGSSIYSFDLPEKGNVSAVVTLNNLTSNSIEYSVSITDPKYVLMGNKDYQNGAGLYAVRFTYDYMDNGVKKEVLLATEYDDRVYTSSGSEGLKMSFVLNNDKLLYYNNGNPTYPGQEIKEDTNYTIHIFAVTDFDSDGFSEVVSLENGVKKSWNYFFDTVQTDRKCINFASFLNSFWPTSTLPSNSFNTDLSGIRYFYEIGNSTKKTMKGGDTYSFNSDYASFVRKSGYKICLSLTESFNIAEQNNTQQAFHKIAYSISGFDSDGVVNLTGESLASKNNQLFTKIESYGYSAYEYMIPENIKNGRYFITMQFYVNENDAAPAITLSRQFMD